MDHYCGSLYWNQTLTWESYDVPDLTWCFEETALFYSPMIMLLVLTIAQTMRLKSREWFRSAYKYRRLKETTPLAGNGNETNDEDDEKDPHNPIPWTVLNVMKITIWAVFIPLAIFELFSHFWFLYLDSDESISLVHWVNPCVKVGMFLYLTNLAMLHRRNGVYSSAPVFIFTMLYLFYNILSYRTLSLSLYSNGHYLPEFTTLLLIVRTMVLYLCGLQMLLYCFNEYTPETDLNPHTTVGFPSRITFWWFTSMIITGYRRPLTERDVWRLDIENKCKSILKRLERKIDGMKTEKIIRKMQQTSEESQMPSTSEQARMDDDIIKLPQQRPISINVATLCFRVYWKQFTVVVILKLVASLLTFSNPIFLDRLLTFMTVGNEPVWRGVLYAGMMFFVPMLESILNNQYEYWVNLVTMRVRTCLNSLIYTKSLRLSTYGKRDFSTGEIINLMSVDAQRVSDFLNSLNSIWTTPVQFSIAMYLLWQQVGASAIGGIVFLCILVPVNMWISSKVRLIQVKLMIAKDSRTKWMNEILNGIKVLKLCAWEMPFIKEIERLRGRETQQLYRSAYFSSCMFFAFGAAPLLVGVITFTSYVLSGGILDPNKAFVSLSLFNIMRVPMGMLPMLLSLGAMSLVAVKRINRYLNSPEIDDTAITSLPNHEHAISIRDASFTWSEVSTPLLRNISLNVPHGKLIAIVGHVGSGKSSLLSAILSDMEKISGKVNVDGKIAYVPQQAWIQNATVRKNITFTRSFDERRYQKIIQSCCLEPDLRILAGGDLTEVGERGINLSGGQKQRISISRAVYSNANIFLLDDPLSAVDAHVSKQLFDNVISNNGLLRNKTRVLVTHRVSCLPEVDEIIVMKDSQISERGTINELVEKQGAFAEFITEYLDQSWRNRTASKNGDDADEPSDRLDEDPEMLKSLVEKVRPILERTKSRTDSVLTGESSLLQKSQRSDRSLERSNGTVGAYRRQLSRQAQLAKATETQLKDGKLIGKENAETGSVKWSVYLKYFQTVGFYICLVILGGLVVANIMQVLGSLWLSEWSNDALDPVLSVDESQRNLRIAGYAGFGSVEIVFSLVSTLALNIACIRAARVLHNEMLESVLFAPMSFFDTTPIGRILNRFSKDVDVADFSLVFNLRMMFMQFFRTLVALIMISLEAGIILAVLFPVLIFYYLIQRLYIATSRQLKRIESTTRSPIYNHFSETVQGSTTIRAYAVCDRFISECNKRIDVNNSCYYASFTATRWLSVRLEFFGYFIVFMTALFAALSRGILSPGLAGLAISYSLNITGTMAMFIRCATDLETNIVSIERLLEYSELSPEAKYHKPEQLDGWPTQGEVRFENYSTRYRDGMSLVLRNVTFTIKPKEKVGIVGRTGAGKSSLTLALFRLIEPVDGKIIIDHVDISKLGLYELRSKITIIPQDPVLFTGSFRLNLDPFNTRTDNELWSALELAHLKDFVLSLNEGLNYKVVEGGENLSVGQRQLLCLARAVLRKTKVLVLDEATAAIDMETDDLIQDTIRKEFADCTIITIAHRLNTVLDYDKILVLDNGQVVEFDAPQTLLNDKQSVFYSMASAAKIV